MNEQKEKSDKRTDKEKRIRLCIKTANKHATRQPGRLSRFSRRLRRSTKCYSACVSELSVPARSDLQTNHRVKLALLCTCVCVCVCLGHVRACLHEEEGGGYIKRERPYRTVPSRNVSLTPSLDPAKTAAPQTPRGRPL